MLLFLAGVCVLLQEMPHSESYHSRVPKNVVGLLDLFSTAVPFRRQTTLIPSRLSRKRDCSPKRVHLQDSTPVLGTIGDKLLGTRVEIHVSGQCSPEKMNT